MKTTISYKTKIREFTTGEKYIDYKKTVSRSNCPLRPHQHSYYNCDMFPSMLQRAYDTAINNKRWCRLDALPDTVKIDGDGFLATVTVTIELRD